VCDQAYGIAAWRGMPEAFPFSFAAWARVLIRTHAATLQTARYYGPSWCNESSSSFPHDIFAVPMYYPSNHNKDWPIYPTEPAGNNWTIQLATIAYALMMVRLKRPLVRHHDTHTHTHVLARPFPSRLGISHNCRCWRTGRG